jgi:hypothetical protein
MDGTPEQPQDAAEDQPDDVKARYKQALEHKQEQHRNERLHPEAGSSLHEPHGRSGGKRQFRRKSGG